jgi:hypothetical protein
MSVVRKTDAAIAKDSPSCRRLSGAVVFQGRGPALKQAVGSGAELVERAGGDRRYRFRRA